MDKRSKVNTKWHKLDNTANVFPVVASKRLTTVFRLTTVIYDKIIPEYLQKALDNTLPNFNAFCVRLRHGLFWSYLEANNAPAFIEEEREAPCQFINTLETNRYLFKVLYYENRIHLEVLHALTDGSGAMKFLKAISYEYIKFVNANSFTSEQMNTAYGTQGATNTNDEYIKNYVPQKIKTFKEETAFRCKGELREPGNIGVLTAILPVEPLKQISKSYNASISEYLTALLIQGIYKEYMGAAGSKRPINIFIPVDLRRIFETDTSVNFFSNIVVSVKYSSKEKTFEQVLDEVKAGFNEQLRREFFEQKMSFTVRSETNFLTRIIPLPLKIGILKVVYEHSSHGSTTTFSNLGVQDILPEFEKYIEGFRFLVYVSEQDTVKCGVVSAKGEMAITFTTSLEGFPLAKYIARELVKQGIEIEIESNGDSDEELP